MNAPKPFTMSYVLGVTIDNQLKAVDFSLNKVLARSREPGLSKEVSWEIFRTLQALYNSRQHLLAQRESLK